MPELTVPELARELRCSPSKIFRMTRAGQIPYLRVGRLLRYELDAVKAALRVEVANEDVRPRRVSWPLASPISATRIQEMRRQIRETNRARRPR